MKLSTFNVDISNSNIYTTKQRKILKVHELDMRISWIWLLLTSMKLIKDGRNLWI